MLQSEALLFGNCCSGEQVWGRPFHFMLLRIISLPQFYQIKPEVCDHQSEGRERGELLAVQTFLSKGFQDALHLCYCFLLMEGFQHPSHMGNKSGVTYDSTGRSY